MSSDQSDINAKEGGNGNGSSGTPVGSSKAFPRSPLDFGSSLLGAGSPSFESRLSYKRAREIQQQEGVPAIFWSSSIGSSSSSPSKTPAEPMLPEDMPSTEGSPNVRRARAGTVPSRFTNPLEESLGALTLQPKHAASTIDLVSNSNLAPPLPPPAAVTPARPHPVYHPPPVPNPQSSAVSRLRSGSLTLPRAIYQARDTPFGPSIFSSSYVNRSGLSPASPAHSAFSRDDEQTPVKTLDYLGLADTPTPPRLPRGVPGTTVSEANGLPPHQEEQEPLPGFLSASSRLRDASRIRSYSVADKDKYDEEHAYADYDEDEGGEQPQQQPQPQVLTHQSYLQDVQTTPKSHYSNLFLDTHSPRPRASTTGVINSPPSLTADLFGGPIQHRLDQKLSRGLQQQAYSSDQSGQQSQHRQISQEDQPYYSTYNNSNEDISSQPSRALWIATVPQGVTQQHLETIFSQYGVIESSRVLSHKNCGFVNFVTVEDAVNARSALSGRELFPGTGGIKIGFAKVPSGIVLSPSPEPLLLGGSGENSLHHLSAARLEGSRSRSPALPPLRQIQGELIQILVDFGASEDEIRESTESVHRAGNYTNFRVEIPPFPEPSAQRNYDAPKLRDIRKRIDNGTCSPEEIQHIAVDMLPEIAELSSDYLGNTVVQKLFENCDEEVKTRMLVQIAPYLASIGVHKNGTWAAQKIIDCARTDDQMRLITENLHPFTPALFLDQFGNYVVQCCLRFGQPWTDFIFESMMEKLWDIAQGRFGARAMRACLESHSASKEQQRLMAAVITLHSVRLATNANGALLLTWLLDTCNFPNRFKILAPRLLPQLAKLCTHKLASLTVLKLINQRTEPEAREVILTALFHGEDDNKVLRRILEDQVNGAAVIYKVLTSPFVADQGSSERRQQLVAIVRQMLQKIKAQPTQGYKRLMDEVGLSDRTVATPPLNGHRGPPNRATTPREYASPNTYAPGAFYSPQHNYGQSSQQYVPQQTVDMLGRPTNQLDPSLLGMEIHSPGQMYSPQLGQSHTHAEPGQAAAYQYQQMMILQQQQQQRSYNNYSSLPPQQSSHQSLYQSPQPQTQFGGPLLPGQQMYVNGTQGYPNYNDPYRQQRPR